MQAGMQGKARAARTQPGMWRCACASAHSLGSQPHRPLLSPSRLCIGAGGAGAGPPAAAPQRGAVLWLLERAARRRRAPVPAAGEVRRQPGGAREPGGAAAGARPAGDTAAGRWAQAGCGVQAGLQQLAAAAPHEQGLHCQKACLLSSPPPPHVACLRHGIARAPLLASLTPAAFSLCVSRRRLGWRTCTATAWPTWTSSLTTSTCRWVQRCAATGRVCAC